MYFRDPLDQWDLKDKDWVYLEHQDLSVAKEMLDHLEKMVHLDHQADEEQLESE